MLSENLQRLRMQSGLSQKELAEKLHVVRQTVSKWEKGLSVPDADMLLKLAAIFNTTPNELLGAENPAPLNVEELTWRTTVISEQIQAQTQRFDHALDTVKRVVLLAVVLFFGLPLLGAALFAIQEFSGSIATQEAAINRTIIEYELGGQTSQFVIDVDAYDPTAVISYTGSPTIADAVDVQQFYNIPGSASEFEEAVCTYIEDHGGTVTSVETISES